MGPSNHTHMSEPMSRLIKKGGCVQWQHRGIKDTLVSNLVVLPSLGRRPPLSPTFFYSKICLVFFPYIVHYPTHLLIPMLLCHQVWGGGHPCHQPSSTRKFLS